MQKKLQIKQCSQRKQNRKVTKYMDCNIFFFGFRLITSRFGNNLNPLNYSFIYNEIIYIPYKF